MDKDIQAIKRKLLVKYGFFGSILANTKFIDKSGEIETAATDGKNIYYNKEFLNELNDNEKVFVFAHECSHIAFNHIKRAKGKDIEIWNIATDAVINALLKDDGFEMKEGFVDMPEAIDYNSEEFYEKLIQEDKEQNNNYQNSHQLWDYQYEISQDGESGRGGRSDNSQDDNSGKGEQNSNSNDDLSKEQEENSKMGEKEVFKKSKEQRKNDLEKLKEALAREASSSKQAGDTTNSERRRINIGKAKPLVNWKGILKENAKYDLDWSYQNASIEYGVVNPSLEKFPNLETEIVIDTSGSVDGELLKKFFQECKNVLKISRVRIGCFDTRFYGFKEIKYEKELDQIEILGGGGTNFDVAVEAFSLKAENKIIFTDGCASMPRMACNVTWIVYGNEICPKGGRVIYIK
ncbi:MAG: VWA-like domain-containing protein [Clostridia bacterium]|nr:VWA-like domain-containing protein [Clostridia bacterium]